MVRFQLYMLVRESPLTQLPPGNRMNAGCNPTSTSARSGRRPFVRLWNVCRGKSETTSSHTVPACEMTTDNRPLALPPDGTNGREKCCQPVIRPVTGDRK